MRVMTGVETRLLGSEEGTALKASAMGPAFFLKLSLLTSAKERRSTNRQSKSAIKSA
jgi:hypothetical protein